MLIKITFPTQKILLNILIMAWLKKLKRRENYYSYKNNKEIEPIPRIRRVCLLNKPIISSFYDAEVKSLLCQDLL